jgi:hypothetical protein
VNKINQKKKDNLDLMDIIKVIKWKEAKKIKLSIHSTSNRIEKVWRYTKKIKINTKVTINYPIPPIINKNQLKN